MNYESGRKLNIREEIRVVRIANFTYCMNAVTGENEANILGVLSAITPEYIPGTFSFAVFCSILDLSNGNHAIQMQFVNPDNEVLVNIDGVVPCDNTNPFNLPSNCVGINISTCWQNVVLKKSGMYKTIVTVDNIECGAYEIYVKGKNEVN